MSELNFECRWLEEGDYEEILVPWWKDHRWVPPPKDFLPDDGKSGIILSKDGVDICAGFLYFANSKTCFMEFIVSNFHYREADRGTAITFLINTLSETAKENGHKYVYTNLKNASLILKYEECGFIKGSTNSTEMVMTL
jgi:hypothetical protein